MRQFFGAFLGMMVGGALLAALAVAGVTTTALGGVIAYVVLQQDEAPARATVRTRRATAPGGVMVRTGAGLVTVQVDGRNATYDNATGAYIASVAPGSHLIEVFNPFMKRITSMKVNVRSGKRVMLDYSKKRLSKTGEATLRQARQAPRPAPRAPAPAPAPTLSGFQLPFGASLSNETETSSRSSETATQYGEDTVRGPGGSSTRGFENTQHREQGRRQRSLFSL